jgi:hypothetical protein
MGLPGSVVARARSLVEGASAGADLNALAAALEAARLRERAAADAEADLRSERESAHAHREAARAAEAASEARALSLGLRLRERERSLEAMVTRLVQAQGRGEPLELLGSTLSELRLVRALPEDQFSRAQRLALLGCFFCFLITCVLLGYDMRLSFLGVYHCCRAACCERTT